MNKRLSFSSTVAIAIFTLVLIFAVETWASNTFGLPDWFGTLMSSMALFSYFEITGQLGPEPFDTPLTAFSTLCARDKIVVLFACAIFIVLTYPIGLSFDSFWITSIFIGVAILSFGIICLLFGTAELRERLRLTRKSDTAV